MKLVNKRISCLAKKPKELERILNGQGSEEEKTYLIKIRGKQMKIVDAKNKLVVKDESDLKSVKKRIDDVLEEMNKSKKYEFAIYR